MDYIIRPSEPGDAPGLAALRRMPGVFETTLGLPSSRTADSETYLDSLGDEDHHFVAEAADGTIIGAVGLMVRANPRTRHVGSVGIFVHTDWQNKGVGTALLKTVLDLADNWLMLVRVELEVFADNDRARHLYEKLGFELEGRRRMAVVKDGAFIDELMLSRIRPTGEHIQEG